MTALLPMILMAVLGGALVVVSRSVNGRLSLATSPLRASFWNHAVGAVATVLIALILGDLVPPGLAEVPLRAWLGGPVGVVFIALGSYLVARIGAAMTAMLVIAGQMISGVAADLVGGAPGALVPKMLGVALILGGMRLAQRRFRRGPDQSSTR